MTYNTFVISLYFTPCCVMVTVILFLQLLVLAFIQVISAEYSFSIPLQKDPDTIESLRAAYDHALARYSLNPPVKTFNATDATVPLYNYKRWLAYGNIFVGSPAYAYICIFDTGSSDTWLFSVSNCTDNNFCTESSTRRKYNSSLSSSFTPTGTPFEASYGSGSVSGYWSRERMFSGNLFLPSQDFIEITQADAGVSNIPVSSLIGLGWPALSDYSQEHPTFPESVWKQYPDMPRIFSMWHREADMPQSGYVYFGGWDPVAFTGQIRWFNVAERSFWQLSLGWTSYWQRHLNTYGFPCIIDSGTSFILMPAEEWDYFEKYLGVQGPDYLIPCERMQNYANVTIRFGPTQEPFILTPYQYMLPVSGDQCTVAMRGMQERGSTMWVLGQTFLRAYFVAHDMDNARIGFAASSK